MPLYFSRSTLLRAGGKFCNAFLSSVQDRGEQVHLVNKGQVPTALGATGDGMYRPARAKILPAPPAAALQLQPAASTAASKGEQGMGVTVVGCANAPLNSSTSAVSIPSSPRAAAGNGQAATSKDSSGAPEPQPAVPAMPQQQQAIANQRWEPPIQMTDSKAQDLTTMNFRASATTRRDLLPVRWSMADLLVLIAAKRSEAEILSSDKTQDNMKTAHNRWKEVEDFCRKEGVNRKAAQFCKRWEKLMTDFRKVYDYQKKLPTGALGYFEMEPDKRKLRKLPLHFLSEWYNAMVVWVPNHRVVNSEQDQVTVNTAEKSFPDQASNQPSRNDCPAIILVGEDMEPVVGNGTPPEDGTNRITGDDDRSRPGEQAPSNDPNCIVTVATPGELDMKGRKRKRPEKWDDRFVKMMGQFLEALKTNSLKRNVHAEEFLELERQMQQKHSEHVAWSEEQQHAEHLAQARKIATDVSGALKEIAASLRFFATEITKKM